MAGKCAFLVSPQVVLRLLVLMHFENHCIGEYMRVFPFLGVDDLYRTVPSFSGPVSLSWQRTWKLACL